MNRGNRMYKCILCDECRRILTSLLNFICHLVFDIDGKLFLCIDFRLYHSSVDFNAYAAFRFVRSKIY